MLLALAWRNLWRSPKRTIILVASVFFAVVIAVAMRSMQRGEFDALINLTVKMYTGSMQVQGKKYWEKKTLEESIEVSREDLSWIASRPHITNVTPRLESFALVAHLSSTKVTPVIGIDPESETGLTGLRQRLIHGTWLSPQDTGAIIAAGLAHMLGVNVGDTIVLYGQGYHGTTAAAQVIVQGIVKFPIPDLNNAIVYLSLAHAQWLFSAPDRVTSAAVLIDDPALLNDVANDLRTRFNDKRTVLTWSEMEPDVEQAIQAKTAGSAIFLIILYIVIGFGILGTVMMMTAERRREFGVLIAIGMKRRTLIITTFLETIMVSMLGAMIGVAIGAPLVAWLSFHPIPITGNLAETMQAYGMEANLQFSRAPGIFLTQCVNVLSIGLVCALYPWLAIRKLLPVDAMHGK